MVEARLELKDYTKRVLDVIKGKYGLKSRSEALNRFAIEKGNEYVEPKPSELVLREIDATYEKHLKKNRKRKMNEKELNNLLGLD